jgi:hypothetical protein
MRSQQTLRSFFFILVGIVTALASAQRVSADTLYGATGSRGVAGHLLILDPTTGAVVTDVGELQDSAGNKYGLTGLAFEPITGRLFGSVANSLNTPTPESHLVLINPNNAQITDIGSFFGSNNSTMSDITFDPITGTLYGWRSAEGHGLYTINTATGAATLVGGTTSAFGGGGLAASLNGTLFNTPDGVSGLPSGHLTTVDKTTGAPTIIGLLSGSFTIPVITAMDFDSGGVLFGVERNAPNSLPRTNTALSRLVTIDTATGLMTDLGSSIDNLDAIAFLRSTAPEQVPEPISMLLLGLGLASAFLWVKRPQLSKILVLTTRKRQRS